MMPPWGPNTLPRVVLTLVKSRVFQSTPSIWKISPFPPVDMRYITINIVAVVCGPDIPQFLRGQKEHFLGVDLISVFKSSDYHLSITIVVQIWFKVTCFAQVATTTVEYAYQICTNEMLCPHKNGRMQGPQRQCWWVDWKVRDFTRVELPLRGRQGP